MKLTNEQAMERYPFLVYFPQPGEYRLLIIHTESEQQQFLLAKTEEKLKLLYNVMMKRLHYPPQPRELWAVKMVHPPFWLELKYATTKYECDLFQFRHMLGYQMEKLLSRSFHVPGVRLCKSYEKAEDDEIYNGDEDYHVSCKSCDGSKIIFDCDIEEIFLKKQDLVKQLDHVGRPPIGRWTKKGPVRPHPVKSLAEEFNPHDKVYMAKANHGSHAHGNQIVELTEDEVSFMANGGGFPLFLFQGEKLCDAPAWAKKIDNDYRDRRKKSEKNRGKEVAEEQNKQDKERERILKEIFT